MGSLSGQGWAWLLGGLVLQSHPRLAEECGEEGAVDTPPFTHTHTDAHSGMKTHNLLHCGPVLKGSCSFGNSPVLRGQARARQRGKLLELKNLISYIFPSAHLPKLLSVPLTCCKRAPSLI